MKGTKKAKLSVKQLQRLGLRLFKMGRPLHQASEADPVLKPIWESLRKVELELMALAHGRELAAAEKADRGEVCWELFGVRMGSTVNRPARYVRTPRRFLADEYYTLPPEWALQPTDAWQHLERLWHKREFGFDAEKFRQHAARVDAQWKMHQQREAVN